MQMRLVLGAAACTAGAALALIVIETASSEALLSGTGSGATNSARPAQTVGVSHAGSAIDPKQPGMPAAGAQLSQQPVEMPPRDPVVGVHLPPVSAAGPSVFEQQARAQQSNGNYSAGPSVYEQQLRAQQPGPGPITAGPGPIRR